MRTRIEHLNFVLTVDAEDTVLRDATVVIEDDRIVAINPDARFIPASNTKMFTTAAAYMTMPDILDAMCVGCERKTLRSLIIGIRNRVAQGDNLAVAMTHYQKLFSRFFIAAIDVGNETGRYSGVMMYVNRHLTWLYDTWMRAKKELRMPLVTLVFVSGLIPWLLIYAVHFSMHANFTLEPELIKPVQTYVSPLITEYWRVTLLAPLVLYGIVRILLHTPGPDIWVGRLLLAFPWFGRFNRAYDILNFTYFFALMWEAGISVVPALHKAKQVMQNPALRHAVSRIEDQVHSGSTLSQAFARSGYFSIELVIALRHAETTGNFAALLDGVHHFAVRKVEDDLFALSWVLRLSLLGVSGIMVLGLGSAVYGI